MCRCNANPSSDRLQQIDSLQCRCFVLSVIDRDFESILGIFHVHQVVDLAIVHLKDVRVRRATFRCMNECLAIKDSSPMVACSSGALGDNNPKVAISVPESL